HRRPAAQGLRRRPRGRADQGVHLQDRRQHREEGGGQARFVLVAQRRRTPGARRADGCRAAVSEHADRFTHLRPLLFTIVYEILGSATETEDVLQDSYLRWTDVDLATVRDTKSYLGRLVTRQALNARRASARSREDYVGPWLPEPLLLDEHDPES